MTFNWLNAVTTVLPVALAAVPGMPPALVPVIVHGITEAEAMNVPGEDKKLHVLNMVRLGIDAVNATQHETVIDKEKVMPVIEHSIDVGVSIANLLGSRNAPR